MLPLAMLLAAAQKPTFEFDVESGKGLTVRVGDVNLIRGSWFQYVEPDWSKGHYSSTWNTQQVRRVDPDTVELSFAGAEGKVKGTQTFRREGDRLRVRTKFEWTGDRPVRIEATSGMVWAPALQAGTLNVDGQSVRSLRPIKYTKGDVEERRYGADGKSFAFQAPFADVRVTSSVPLTLFDGRGYEQDWARGRQLWWLGGLGFEATRERPLEYEVVWEIKLRSAPPLRTDTLSARAEKVAVAVAPDESRLPLVPRPRAARLDASAPISINGGLSADRMAGELNAAIRRRFMPSTSRGKARKVTTALRAANLPADGYRIRITQSEIRVEGQGEQGLRYGLLRLANLAFAKDGRLWLPTGEIEDAPAVDWRGVHLFVGPVARPFQRRLWERVLLPMGFNKVVLQCERTDWQTLAGVREKITMPRAELKRLFDDYRTMGVEPIPMIQSFGHMEWFFANGKNLELAYNPSVPYSIDPRKPKAREAVAKVWDEVIALLQPKTIHFGLDEVDMRGFEPKNPKLVTELWGIQLPFLGGIARKHGKEMMLWGDKALAPDEAPDAAHGDSKAEAAARRAAIPKGAYLTDWHYKPDVRPETFRPVLQLWKREGYRPIASAWYRPENVRGFNLAAVQEGVGTLQTTWAGYESYEPSLLQHLEQYSAMILAAEYAWSANPAMPDALGYDPKDLLRRLYFGRPSPIQPLAGWSFVRGGRRSSHRVGSYRFEGWGDAVSMRSLLTSEESAMPTNVIVPIGAKMKSLAVAVSAAHRSDDGEVVAEITADLEGGGSITVPVVYGRHVRSADDTTPLAISDRAGEVSAVVLDVPTGATVRRLRVSARSSTAGLRIHGVSGW